jgi:hypothetical protein
MWFGGAAVVAALGLSSCGQQSGEALAQQACVHVTRSIHYFTLSTQPDISRADASRLLAKADAQLRAALPLASAATSDDGSMNSLMTTISESATVDEAHLVPALKGQCANVDTNVNVNPQAPGNIPGS